MKYSRLNIIIFGIVVLFSYSFESVKRISRFNDQDKPLVFNSLNLKHLNSKGEREWDITSKHTTYDLNKRLINAYNPKALFYVLSEPTLKVSGSKGRIINDGELILIDGNVVIEHINGLDLIIKGKQIRWDTSNSLMVLD